MIFREQENYFLEYHNYIIQLLALCKGCMTICSYEFGNVTEGNINCQGYYPHTRATIFLFYRILTSATARTAMMSPEGIITCEGKNTGKPDRILPCTGNALIVVTSQGHITYKGNITG